MGLPGSPPFTLACPGDSQGVIYSIHPQEAPVSHPCSASQAHNEQRFTSSSSWIHSGCLFPCLADSWAGGVHAGRRCLYTSASRCCQLGSAMWETGLNSCSFCPPLVVSDAGEGGTLLAAAPRGCGDESGRESSDFVC